ncbi:MAG: DUF935 family protein [Gallionella sp.]|jgi:SPP1 gp7 family putative phage head morphogenesis protein
MPETDYQITDLLSVVKSSQYEKSQKAPYNPDDLVQKFGASGTGIDKYQTMKTDDAVKASLYMKKSAILSTGWRIDPALMDDPAEQEKADFVSDNLTELFEGNFDNSLFELLSALEYGFSLTEKVYKAENGKIFLYRMRTIPPQSIEFHTDDYGNLLDDGLKQWTMKGLISLPLSKFIYYCYNAEFGNWYGNSDLRSAYRSWFSKDKIIKFQNIYLERFGNPLVVIKYDRNTAPDEREDMESIVKNLSAKTSILMHKDTDIEIKENAKTASDEFNRAIQQHNTMIMNSILLPEKLGFGGDTGGSYALGKVQQSSFVWVIQKIRNEVQTILNEQLIRELVDLNFGEQEAYPKFVFNELLEENKDEKAKIIIDAIARGAIQMSNDTENYLRGLLNLPEKEETDEPEPEVEQVGAVDKGETEPSNPDDPDDDGDTEGSDDDGDEADIQKKYKLNRALTAVEKKVDFKKLEKLYDTLADEGTASLKKQLGKIRDDFTTQIKRKNIMEDKNIQGAKDLEFRYIRDYALEAEGMLRDAYDKGNKFAKEVIKKSKFAKKAPTNVGLVKGKAIIWLKEKAKLLTGDVSGKLQDKCKQVVINGVMNGDPTNLIVERVDSAFSDYTDSNLYTNVNTNIASAMSAGKSEYYQDLEAEGEIVGYQWSSILDPRTTEGCTELDGMRYKATDPIWNELHIPRHYNCRSEKVPILLGEVQVEEDETGEPYEWDEPIAVTDEFSLEHKH